MNALLVVAMAASGFATWGVIVGLHRLHRLVVERCPHYDWFGICTSCRAERADPPELPNALPKDIFGGYYVRDLRPERLGGWVTDPHSPTPPIGKSLLGSPKRPEPVDDDSAFWEGRPAHPDRPDEDWPRELPGAAEGGSTTEQP